MKNTKVENKIKEDMINKIIQGDCLEVMKKISDNSIDCVIADPPYGIGVDVKMKKTANTKYGKAAALKKDYGHTDWDNKTPDKEVFDEIIRISKNQIIFGGNYFTDKLPQSDKWLVWDKKSDDNNFSDCELIYTSFKGAIKVFRFLWKGMMQENMKQKEYRHHPTQKPIPLMQWIIRNYTKENDLILDPFAGSGSTCVAAQNLHRRFIGIELEEKYCEIARDRLKQQTLI